MKIEQLKAFCANKSDPREYLQKPMKFGAEIAASNGQILCLVPGNDRDSGFEEVPIGMGESLKRISIPLEDTPTNPVETVADSVPESCGYCKGTGKTRRVTCRECDGDGEVDAETDYSTYYNLECKTCDGNGTVESPHGVDGECGVCQGAGTKPETDCVFLNSLVTPIQRRYWNLIKELPGLSVGEHQDHSLMVLFRFDGGRGAVMGVRSVEREEVAGDAEADTDEQA